MVSFNFRIAALAVTLAGHVAATHNKTLFSLSPQSMLFSYSGSNVYNYCRNETDFHSPLHFGCNYIEDITKLGLLAKTLIRIWRIISGGGMIGHQIQSNLASRLAYRCCGETALLTHWTNSVWPLLNICQSILAYVLGYEEPDCSGSGSADMTVHDGLSKWESLIAPLG